MEKLNIIRFLFKLATDDNYRQAFVNDPVGVGTAAGIDIRDLPPAGSSIVLPSKEDIVGQFEDLIGKFEMDGCLKPMLH